MSLIAFMGALESGLLYALVAFGVLISFRVLEFPDLTVDGSFPLGAAVAATLIVSGFNPWFATLSAIFAGAVAGLVTAWMYVRLGILNLLASILSMIALYSVNLRIMGKPNVALLGESTLLTPLDSLPIPYYISYPIAFALVVLVLMSLFIWFLKSEIGLAMRATGANPRMARANGINTSRLILVGMALSNAFVALAGALFAQSQGSADVTMGVGVIVIGLAAVIGGEAVITPKTIVRAVLACLVGALLYRLAVAAALNADFLGLQAQDLNLITAVLVAFAIVLPKLRQRAKLKGGKA
ncbi:ABC transporter permease [Balneatrix alpica]|uniref:ABC transporter permease n=1 Tax=Balneatrix alpica TaxID=75684 RepID=A0ABV5ZCD3_9GAMM|nr:ABC transporter permease [Balneatrix alpica]